MKPAPFDYYAPTSVAEALERLNELGYAGKVLAGGQSLIPSMNFRLAQPAALVDLNNVPELFYVKPANDGGFLIGTMTRTSTVEHHPDVLKKTPMIGEAMVHIAHPQIRNRGTFGGNLAHADPAGQLPGVAVSLGFRMLVRSKKSGERWVEADDFFVGPFATVIEPDEMLAEVYVPALAPRTGSSYRQVARVRGAQCQAAVAVKVALDPKGNIQNANIVMLAVGERPLIAHQANKLLERQAPTDAAFQAAANSAAYHEIDPGTDIHATAEYRRHICEVLVRRALKEAVQMAMQRGG